MLIVYNRAKKTYISKNLYFSTVNWGCDELLAKYENLLIKSMTFCVYFYYN